jgi:hypothetical protein
MWVLDGMPVASWAGWALVILAVAGIGWAVWGVVRLGWWLVLPRDEDELREPGLEPLPPERSWAELTGPQPVSEDYPWECPRCGDWFDRPGFDHEPCWQGEMYEEDEDPARVFVLFDAGEKGRTGPASLPRPDLRGELAALLAEHERLAAPIVPDWVNEDLEAAGFKTYDTNAAAVDSIVMRAIQMKEEVI